MKRLLVLFGALPLALLPAYAQPVNLATNGAVVASSFGNWGAASTPLQAIDGSRDGNYYHGHIWHSSCSESPWIEVDLGNTFYLDRVQIFTRTDVNQPISNIRLRVLDATDNELWSGSYLTTFSAGKPWATADMRGVQGRKVRLESLSSSASCLAMAELEIYGQSLPLGPNLALNQPATASPAGWGSAIPNANDGNLDGDYSHPGNPIYHSLNAGIGTFWQVDLETTNYLGYVLVMNRTDSPTTSNVRISVLDGGLNTVASTTVNINSSVVVLEGQQYGITVPLPANASGRYLRVETTGNEFLALGEVQVFAPPATPLAILRQPVGGTRYLGGYATFAPAISGTPPFQFQWMHEGTNLPTATNLVLALSILQSSDEGSYVLTVTDSLLASVSTAPVTLALVATTPDTYEEFVVTNHPLAYWRFQDGTSATAYDYAGGHDAANTAVNYVAGPQPPGYTGLESTNTAAAYDGSSSKSETATSLVNDLSQFTLIGWMNPAVMPQLPDASSRVALFGQNDCVEFGFHGTNQLGIWTWPTGLVAFDPATLIQAGQWYFLAVVGDGVRLSLYVNGNLVASGAATAGSYGSSPFPFRIGAGVLDPSGNYFNGDIDEVAVFDHALSVQTINALYAKAAGVVAPSILTQPKPQTLYAGQTARFSVAGAGTLPFVYIWQKDWEVLSDGGNISGAGTAELTIANISEGDQGQYAVTIVNQASLVDSDFVALTVMPRPTEGYEGLVLAAQPLGYWKLDEASGSTAAYDYCGGFNGLYGGGAIVGVTGPQPPEFPGFPSGNTAVQCANAPSSAVALPPLNLNTNCVTIAAWVYPLAVQNWPGLVYIREGDSLAGLHFGGGNELRYTWSGDQATWGWSSGLLVPPNQWSFVAVVVTPTNGTLYMGTSGKLRVAVNAVNSVKEHFGGTTCIGYDSGGLGFNGIMDNVAIYNQSLSEAQIAGFFLSGTALEPRIFATPSDQVVADSKPVGNPHVGLNNGAAWLASDTDGASVTRQGVMAFAATSGNQITVAANPDFNSTAGAITFWMRSAGNVMANNGDYGAILFDRRTSVGDVIVMKDDGTLFVQVANSLNSFSTVGTVNDSRWHHVAYVYDQSAAGGITLYIDGVQAGSQGNAGAWSWPASQQIELGRSWDPFWRAYDGWLDDFRIYNRALTPTEVGQIAAGDDPSLTTSEAMVLRFSFDTAPRGFLLEWTCGRLQGAGQVTGPFVTVPGATQPWPVSALAPWQFFQSKLD